LTCPPSWRHVLLDLSFPPLSRSTFSETAYLALLVLLASGLRECVLALWENHAPSIVLGYMEAPFTRLPLPTGKFYWALGGAFSRPPTNPYKKKKNQTPQNPPPKKPTQDLPNPTTPPPNTKKKNTPPLGPGNIGPRNLRVFKVERAEIPVNRAIRVEIAVILGISLPPGFKAEYSPLPSGFGLQLEALWALARRLGAQVSPFPGPVC